MKTQVYIASTKSLENEERFAKLYQTVSKYRQNKIDRYKTPGEKRLSLGVGLLLAMALEKEGYSEKEMTVLAKDNGRPYFKDHEDIFFSLSHSNERVICAISPKPIGCDVEFISENSDVDIDTWPEMESYSKASDTSIIDLMGGKVSYSSEYNFRQIELNDQYKYVVCSLEKISDSQIHQVEI